MCKNVSVAAVCIVVSLGFALGARAQGSEWTPWLNRDTPGGSGDYETLAEFLKAGKACQEPTDIQCQTTDGKNWRDAGQVYICDAKKGGICANGEQQSGVRCLDYRVRFLCPGPALITISIEITWLTEPASGAGMERRAPQVWKESVQAARHAEVYQKIERVIMQKVRQAMKPEAQGHALAPGSITIEIIW